MLTTLRARLIASYIGVVLLCLVLAGGLFLALAQRIEDEAVYRNLTSVGTLLTPPLRDAQRNGVPRPAILAGLKGLNMRVLTLDSSNQVTYDTRTGAGSLTGRTLVLRANEGEAGRGRFRDANGLAWNYVTLDIAANKANGAATTLLIQRPPALLDLWLTVRSDLLLAGALALAVALLLAYFLGRSVAGPVRRLALATGEIARGNYAYQVPVSGSRELAQLAERFNLMAAQVRQAHQMERDFLTNVSHDLKTPLTSIQGYSQAILDGAVAGPDGARDAAWVINGEAQRMSRMVADLLDLAELESGQSALNRASLDAAALLRQAAATLQPQAAQAGVTLRVEAAPLPPVLADGDRLGRALLNLVENAVRHTPPGGTVTLRGEVGPRVVTLAVRDTGEGIPPADLPHIFERFYQVDKARTRAAQSSGLGLAIVQQIVQAHGGTISVQSEVGQGTEFRIRLPVDPAPGAPGAERRRAPTLRLPLARP